MSNSSRPVGQNVLLVCTELESNLQSRRLLKDFSLLLEKKKDMTILIHKNSVLDIYIEKNKLKCRVLYFNSVADKITSRLNYFFQIKKFLSYYFYDTVHLYNFHLIYPVCLILKNEKRTKVLVTESIDFSKLKDSWLRNYFYSRIDQIFVLDRSFKTSYFFRNKNIESKVRPIGMGIELYKVTKSKEDKFIFTSVIFGSEKEDYIQTVLDAIDRLNKVSEREFEYRIHFSLSSQSSAQNLMNIKQLIKTNFKPYIKTFTSIDLNQSLLGASCFICLQFKEPLTEWEVFSLYHHSFVVGSRSIARVQLASRFPSNFFHFKRYDSRELYYHLEVAMSQEVKDISSHKLYSENLLSTYKKHLSSHY